MAKRKPIDIINMVDDHHDATYPMRDRMDEDHKLYRLEPYDAGDGYKSYTSNEPQVFADKIISFLTSAELITRIPANGNDREQRDINNDKERFLIGALKAADDNLCMRMVPRLRDQLAWYIVVRGWYAGRALLIKDEEENTNIDVTPWDPRNTYWGESATGLTWACYKIKKTSKEIKEQYGIKLDTTSYGVDEGVDVYDFYDREDNYVVMDDRVLKKRTKHGHDGVPVFLGMVGANPLIQSDIIGTETIADVGESIFKSNRKNYEDNNFMLSTMLELTARSRRQGLKVKSKDGTKTLEQDPYQEGSEIALATGEDVEPLGMLEMARETPAFMNMLTGEMQRGSLPYSVYGQLDFQLSGYAINTLKQGVESIIHPRIDALEKAYRSIFVMISEQYASGAFESVEVNGQDRGKVYFSETITPEIVEKGGEPDIKLVSQLPQDDMARFSQAQIAREGETPLLPDIFIRDMILGLQDTDQVDDALREQAAERALPEAQLWTILRSLEERGRPDLARFYFGELMKVVNDKQMQMQQQQMQMQQMMQPQPPPQPQQPQGPPMGPPPQMMPPPGGPPMMPPMGGPPMGGPPTLPPEVMPNAAMGGPPPMPTPPTGPAVPPGTPRPGAQSEEERLARIGLLGPGG